LLYRAGFKLPNPIEFESNMDVLIKEEITKKGGVFFAPNGKQYASAKDYFEGGSPINDVGATGGTEEDKPTDRVSEENDEAKA